MTAFLIAGILAAPFLPGTPPWTTLALGSGFVVAAILLRRHTVVSLLCWLMPLAFFGAASARMRETPRPDDVSRVAGGPSIWFTGTVAAEPDRRGRGDISYPLEVTDIQGGAPVRGGLLVTQRADAGPAPRFGDVIRARGRVEVPAGMTNPGGLNYKAFLWRRSIFATLAAKRQGDMVILSRPVDISPRGVAASLRRSLIAALDRSPLTDDDRALVGGVMLADREGIGYETRLAFERTGAMHLLSESGLHLAVFAAVLAFLSRALPLPHRIRIGGSLLAILCLWVFALATGFSSATVRAAVMMSVVLLAPVVRRDAEPLHSLTVAAFVILLFDPLALYDAAFQLSFACVGGVLLWMPPLHSLLFPLEHAMPWHMRLWRGIIFAALGGFVAQVAALPLTTHYFSLVSLVAPLTMLILVPLAETMLVCSLLAAGAATLVTVPTLAWVPVHWLGAGITSAAYAFAAPDWVAISVPSPYSAGVICFYLLFATLGLIFRSFVSRRVFHSDSITQTPTLILATPPILGFLLMPLLIIAPPLIALRRERSESRRLRVTFLDVGQGDAAVVETPDGAVAVIDGGGRPGADERFENEPGRSVVVPFLHRRGITRVDLLAPSHPDDDHVQGLIAVARAFPVGTALDGGVPDGGAGACTRLRALLRRGRVRVVTARRGQSVALGTFGVTLEILHPAVPFLTRTHSVTNANSVIFRLRYGKVNMLFTGDAEEAAEASLLKSSVSLHADVLKVGHHGSRFSSGAAFLAAVRPSVAVISSGRGNNFGHPAPEVIWDLNAVGAAIYRTDHQGAITVETDGERVFVTPTVR